MLGRFVRAGARCVTTRQLATTLHVHHSFHTSAVAKAPWNEITTMVVAPVSAFLISSAGVMYGIHVEDKAAFNSALHSNDSTQKAIFIGIMFERHISNKYGKAAQILSSISNSPSDHIDWIKHQSNAHLSHVLSTSVAEASPEFLDLLLSKTHLSNIRDNSILLDILKVRFSTCTREAHPNLYHAVNSLYNANTKSL